VLQQNKKIKKLLTIGFMIKASLKMMLKIVISEEIRRIQGRKRQKLILIMSSTYSKVKSRQYDDNC
jgi:hypothetical protein